MIGSAQSRSHKRPCEPGSWKRSRAIISLRGTSCGEILPCTQKKRLSTKAATGRDQKERMQASYMFPSVCVDLEGNRINLTPWSKTRDLLLTFAFECEIFR